MKKIIYLAIVLFASVQAYHKLSEPSLSRLSVDPYVVVYGRDSCSITRSMRNELTAQGTPFRYEAIDDSAVADQLHKRMQAQGLNTRRYNLPVVDVNGVLTVRPSSQQVMANFISAQ